MCKDVQVFGFTHAQIDLSLQLDYTYGHLVTRKRITTPKCPPVNAFSFSHTLVNGCDLVIIWWFPARATSINTLLNKRKGAGFHIHNNSQNKQQYCWWVKKKEIGHHMVWIQSCHLCHFQSYCCFIMISGTNIGKSVSQWQQLFVLRSLLLIHYPWKSASFSPLCRLFSLGIDVIHLQILLFNPLFIEMHAMFQTHCSSSICTSMLAFVWWITKLMCHHGDHLLWTIWCDSSIMQ